MQSRTNSSARREGRTTTGIRRDPLESSLRSTRDAVSRAVRGEDPGEFPRREAQTDSRARHTRDERTGRPSRPATSRPTSSRPAVSRTGSARPDDSSRAPSRDERASRPERPTEPSRNRPSAGSRAGGFASRPRAARPSGESSIRLPSDGKGWAGPGPNRVIAGRNGRVKQLIDPSKFIREAIAVEKADYVPQHAFTDFALDRRILANVVAKGYERPSPIQDKTIPLVLSGKDVIGIANTGTGKTAAFALPMIDSIIHDMTLRALILAPTRELAQQIQEECIAFSKGCGIKTALLIGGASMNTQIRELKANPRIIIATPGRLKDHLQQKNVTLERVRYTVLDEFDRMLDMGFIRDITSIFALVPKDRQSLFFSATVDDSIDAQIRKFSRDPITVSVKEGVTADGVDQDVIYFSGKDEKIDKLHDLLISEGRGKTIIFDDTKHLVEKLYKSLLSRGFKADRIHGNKSQAQRSRAIKGLKDGTIDILVATDVAARGIDVSDVSHVINYSQPSTYDDYVHRIGRTGRAGKTGKAFTFLEQ